MNTISREQLRFALACHIGAAQGVHARELVIEILGEHSAGAERELRALIETLRREGERICGTPGEGYYLADSPEELDRTCRFLVDRAMTTLTQVSAMRRVAVPDLYGQLALPTPTPEGATP